MRSLQRGSGHSESCIAKVTKADHITLIMRVHLTAKVVSRHPQTTEASPVLLTIRSAHWLPSHVEHSTTASELLAVLRRRTNVQTIEIDGFREKLDLRKDARLFDVDLQDDVLRQFGFFVD